MSFHEKLIDLRTSRGKLQSQLASDLGCSISTISNWECGRVIPHADQLAQIANYFGVSIDFLLDREEFSDPDIRSIQRAMQGMDQSRKNKFKTMLTAAFDIDFGEEE